MVVVVVVRRETGVVDFRVQEFAYGGGEIIGRPHLAEILQLRACYATTATSNKSTSRLPSVRAPSTCTPSLRRN